MMLYCDLHFQTVDRRGCPWCRIEEIEEAMCATVSERNKYIEALQKVAKSRLEPGHIYQQALMLQKIADMALEVKP